MELERIVRMHNQALEKRAEENIFLNQRIKARLNERQRARSPFAFRFKRAVLAYTFLLLVFTLANLLVINLVKRPGPAPMPAHIVKMDDFRADFPGSISLAYLEVTRWPE